MFLNYRTGVATFIQFIVLSLLGIANALESIITTCHLRSQSCVSNSIPSIIFFIITVLWFGAIWVLGFISQDRRSRLLAYALILIEVGVVLVASFQAKNHKNLINLTTSLVDISLALWVIVLAYKLSRAKGGRIVASERARRRRNLKSEKFTYRG